VTSLWWARARPVRFLPRNCPPPALKSLSSSREDPTRRRPSRTEHLVLQCRRAARLPSAHQPVAAIEQSHIQHGHGHVLGGGSSINAMVWIRGTQADYDGWAEKRSQGLGLRGRASDLNRTIIPAVPFLAGNLCDVVQSR
jgi:choline dehydrogenase-like flavoprotein